MNNWVIDVDGTITNNSFCFSWLTYYLIKAGQNVVILTSRNPKRKLETEEYLKNHNIYYNELIFMDESDPRGFVNFGLWKINKILELKPLVWIDNNIKDYQEFHKELLDTLTCVKVSL